MALRLCWVALCASLVVLVGPTDSAPPRDLPRQNFDTDTLQVRHPSSASPAQYAIPSQPPIRQRRASDVSSVDYPFDTNSIEQLLATGNIHIPHPEGGLLQVTLRDVQHRHGTRIVRVQSEGLPGLITQRGSAFIGTIATRQATYNLSQPGTGRQATQLIDQRQLDLRVTPGRVDYRPVLMPRTRRAPDAQKSA
jgi:hypothetical protein